MEFFHYLFENHPGKGVATRINEHAVSVTLPSAVSIGESTYEIVLDYRDKRTLIVVDGELLWEGLPKGADVVASVFLSDLKSNTCHIRKPRFGVPSYCTEEGDGKQVVTLKLFRHFLLLPCGDAIFRRVRDARSLGATYTFFEVRKISGESSVVWRNTSY